MLALTSTIYRDDDTNYPWQRSSFVNSFPTTCTWHNLGAVVTVEGSSSMDPAYAYGTATEAECQAAAEVAGAWSASWYMGTTNGGECWFKDKIIDPAAESLRTDAPEWTTLYKRCLVNLPELDGMTTSSFPNASGMEMWTIGPGTSPHSHPTHTHQPQQRPLLTHATPHTLLPSRHACDGS